MLTEAEREPFRDALDRVEQAVRAVYAGESELFANLWYRGHDVTLFGAFGPAKRGWTELAAVFPWVADRYGDGTVDFDYVLAWEGADAAYTVGYERARVSIDRGEKRDWTIRVTHVFRREGRQWMLVHRHGDFAPPDDSPRHSGTDQEEG